MAGGVILILVPSGGAEKSIRTVLSVFMLMAFITPFLRGRIEWPLPQKGMYEGTERERRLEQMMLQEAADLFAGQAQKIAEDAVRSVGAEPLKAEILTSISEGGSIVISEVILSLPESAEPLEKEIISAVAAQFETVPLIRYGSGNKTDDGRGTE